MKKKCDDKIDFCAISVYRNTDKKNHVKNYLDDLLTHRVWLLIVKILQLQKSAKKINSWSSWMRCIMGTREKKISSFLLIKSFAAFKSYIWHSYHSAEHKCLYSANLTHICMLIVALKMWKKKRREKNIRKKIF